MTERIALVFFLATATAFAQSEPLPPLRVGETLLNLSTPRLLPEKTWEVRFAHRFSQPVNDGDVHSLWGLDSSADIGIGLFYSPTKRIQLGVFRSDVLDNYELSLKALVFEQSDTTPLSAGFRVGGNFRTEEEVDDGASAFAQAILSKQFAEKFEIFVLPTYVSNAPVSESHQFEHAFNLPIGFAYMMNRYLSLIVEVIPENSDLPDGFDSDFGWAIGLKRAIGGHYFEILFANSRATHVDQYTTSAFLGSGLELGDAHLGFNIERRFGGK